MSAQSRDSAGVRIISVSLADLDRPTRFRLASQPSLLIGSDSTDPRQEFHGVVAAVRLADGAIVVADQGSKEVRFFDARGVFVSASGRRGQGPGEYNTIAALAVLPGDTLLVQDWSSSRVAVLSPAGRLIRTFTLGPAPNRPRAALVGGFQDGTLLGAGSDYLTDAEPPPGVFTLTQTLFTFSATGVPLRTLDSVFERQFLFVPSPRGGVARYIRPFGAEGVIRMSRDGYFISNGSDFEVQEFSSVGRLNRIVRIAAAGRPITERDKAAEKSRVLAFYGQARSSPEFDRMWSNVPWQDQMPAIQRLEIDAGGRLWIERYRAPGDPVPKWIALDRQRRPLGTLTLPARTEVRQFVADGVLAVQRDDLDVERVVFIPFTTRP